MQTYGTNVQETSSKQESPSANEILDSIRQIMAEDDEVDSRSSPRIVPPIEGAQEEASNGDGDGDNILELDDAYIDTYDDIEFDTTSTDRGDLVDSIENHLDDTMARVADSERDDSDIEFATDPPRISKTDQDTETIKHDFDKVEGSILEPSSEHDSLEEFKISVAKMKALDETTIAEPSANQQHPVDHSDVSTAHEQATSHQSDSQHPADIPLANRSALGPGLIGSELAEQVSKSFAQITKTKHSKQRSLEDVVTDALQPMLKSWLDENLPAIVERSVSNEIRRLSESAE